MIVYSGAKSQFHSDVISNDIDNIIHSAYHGATGRHTKRSEINSWSNSLMCMHNVLKAPFCDKKTAQKFGFTPSGSAYAAYDGAPETGPSCAAIKPQARTVKEMQGGASAVYVAMASGGDFTSQGGFGTPAQLAFLLKDGKLAGRLPELQLSSSVYQMYGKDFLGVSSDTIMPLSTHHWLGFEMDVRKA